MAETDLQVRLQVAKQAAYIAGEELRRHRKSSSQFENRADGAGRGDKLSRKAMTTFLGQVYPKEAIAGKEIAPLPNVDEFWVIDSLNGHENYSSGDAHYATVIAWVEKGEPVLGVVYQPYSDILICATKGGGAFLGSGKLSVTQTKELFQAFGLVEIGKKADRAANIKTIEELAKELSHLRVLEAPSIDLVTVAIGTNDVVLAHGLAPWDWLAAKLIIEEAGGMITDLNGEKLTFTSTDVVASNGLIHDQILKIIK